MTAAIPPGDEGLFRMALGFAKDFQPLSAEEAEAMKKRGQAAKPLFRHPSAEA